MRAHKAVRGCILVGLAVSLLLGAAGAQSLLSGQDDAAVSSGGGEINSLELASNRYAQYHAEGKAQSPFHTAGYTLAAHTTEFELWLNESGSAVRLVDKRNGYIWGGANGETGLNDAWASYADSIVGMEYYDTKLVEHQVGLSSDTVTAHYTILPDGFSCVVEMKKQKISFSFSLTLSENGFRFQLPGSSIREKGKYKLKSVAFFPFLGSSYQDEFPGYVFLPDGPGALMPFSKSQSYLTGFDKKIYGDDYSIDSTTQSPSTQTRPGDYINPEPTVMLPVLGIVHGTQNALFTYIESGAEYASVTASPAGLGTDYTWACMRFNYRQKYVQPVNRTDAGVIMPQPAMNSFDVDMTVSPLFGKDANYAGMARFYRACLIRNKVLKASGSGSGDIPLQMELLGADVKKQFLINGTQIFTTASQAASILKQMKSSGIRNITAVLKGYTKGGINGGRLTTTSLDARLGSVSDYETVKRNCSELYLYNNPMTANKNQIDLSGEAGIGISKSYIEIKRQNSQLLFPDLYYYSARLLPARLLTVLHAGWGIPLSGISVEGIGSTLYGDDTRGTQTTRLQAERRITSALSAAGTKTAFYGANQYVLPYASQIFSLPMTNSQYLFETDTVPFLQMVLSGSVPFYAPFVNTSGYSDLSILKMVEYDEYPAFVQTAQASASLVDTPSEDLFSTCFADWKEEIQSIYKKLDAILAPAKGLAMVDHTVLSDGHVRVRYENGKALYINYTETPWKVDSALTVKPTSAQWGT